MDYAIVFLLGLVLGVVGGVVVYRRKSVVVEQALADAVSARERVKAELEALKKKLGQ